MLRQKVIIPSRGPSMTKYKEPSDQTPLPETEYVLSWFIQG